jgi:hypothetical protein
VVKALRKDLKGFCVIAGNISPIDVISHLPILCEDAGVPYIYVPSKEDLGAASCTKRPTSCMLILSKPLKNSKVRVALRSPRRSRYLPSTPPATHSDRTGSQTDSSRPCVSDGAERRQREK